jgi:hypothetical protein
VSGRASVFFPLVMALLASAIDVTRRRRLLFALAPLGAIEFVTGWWLVARSPSISAAAPTFFSYMSTIRETPGVALLDWPFCVAGGNGVGAELCPFYSKNAHVYTYRQFHDKKVVGQYFSRLSPAQIRPFLDAGWSTLFAPDDPEPHRGHAQTRCFDEREWRFVEQLLGAGDFAGVSLYPELLPDGCAERIHARLGPPIATTTLDGVGRAEFIPTPPTLRHPSGTAARDLRLAPPQL